VHPILSERRIFGLYLVVWLIAGGLLALLLQAAGGVSWADSLVLAIPMAMIYGFMCLASYYLCRAFPFQRYDVVRILVVHAIASALTSSLWVSIGRSWASLVAQINVFQNLEGQYSQEVPLLLTVGISTFLLSVAVNYSLIAFRDSREAERQTMQLQFHAQEAELRALRAQINPHFLFNSLNSISALTTADPSGARTMTLRLADFLRRSLTLGNKDFVTVRDEVELAMSFLEIEQVRFGSRLRVRLDIDEEAKTLYVPPLLLQPLVENAVGHGIAHLVDGGEIAVSARRNGSRLTLRVENPCDPDGPRKRGHGIGLENVRSRLKTLFGPEAQLETTSSPDSFRAEIVLPAEPHQPAAFSQRKMQV
jgi:hypothetical protein